MRPRSVRAPWFSALILAAGLGARACPADTVVDFDDLPLAPESYWNGPDPAGEVVPGPYGDVVAGSFRSRGVTFRNEYDLTFGSWSGFAYSNTSDTATPGYLNQFSAITGSGRGAGADAYGVAFGYNDVEPTLFDPDPFDPTDPAQLVALPTLELAQGTSAAGMYVTNTTYAVRSMELGDSFAKRFGGATGADPDWFKLSVYGTDAGGRPLAAAVELYLADFRFGDDALDYIVREWTFLDLTPLAGAHRLHFNLSSSDVGDFGMNTPAYFAVDDIRVVPEPSSLALTALGAAALGMILARSRRPRRPAAALILAGLVGPTAAQAGPYSSFQGVTAGAVDNPIARSQLTVFERSVVEYAPAPGVGANFRSYNTGFASLGDLYSPVQNPAGTNTPFDKRYRPQAGTEPNPYHDGLASNSPFGGDVDATGDTYGFIGVDRPGSITLGFDVAIFDGAGADLAVFENGFQFGGATSLFAELAYVEVSSNGRDFARFRPVSLNTAPTAAAGTFQGYDATNIYNLAGKHAANWGTPFDLGQLASDPLVASGLLDLASVRYVRLVDVVGSGALPGATDPGIARDSLGNPILDNWVTFDSGGFDYLGLRTGAVGVVNGRPLAGVVPEPPGWALGGSGVALLGAFRRIRWARAASSRA